MKKITLFAALILTALVSNVGFNTSARQACAPTEVTEGDVTRLPENTPRPPGEDWVLYTRTGTPPTAGAFVTGPAGAPLGDGSLRFTTNTSSEKVFLFNYDHVGKTLNTVNAISYSTYRTAGSAQQVTALNMQIDYNGAAPGGFATLVFEPVYNTNQGTVVSGQWQTWNAFGSGVWWSTQPINGQCAGATAACDKTWSEIVANNPDAVILAFGVNQGSGNTGLITNVDALTIGFTTATCPFVYDFEPDADADGVGDGSDNCDNNANPGQEDFDNDGAGDACDPDDDNDTYPDVNDCAPKDATINPGATETCNGIDDDCDTNIDEGVTTTFYADADNDGYGNPNASVQACSAPAGYVANGNDCNDNNSAVNPAAVEVCDGIDNDCDGLTDEGFTNTDGDSLADCVDPDDDNDNVPDASDACPGTPAGTQVNNAGCPVPTSKDACKNGGWQTLYGTGGTTFKNQGDCIQYFNTGK
jgi:hypothetical protein